VKFSQFKLCNKYKKFHLKKKEDGRGHPLMVCGAEPLMFCLITQLLVSQPLQQEPQQPSSSYDE
jgi:hypothetical protein